MSNTASVAVAVEIYKKLLRAEARVEKLGDELHNAISNFKTTDELDTYYRLTSELVS